MKHLVQCIARPGKLKNGDHYQFYEDETMLLAAVADGVGGNACDWKASEQVCEDVLYYYQHEFQELGLPEGIALSLRKTFARLFWTKGECEGMRTTLVLWVLDKRSRAYYYFGLGDSKLLKFEDGEVTELTPETDFEIPTDQLSAMLYAGGPLTSGTGFALMSDGIYANRKGYAREIELVLHADRWEEKLDQLMQLHRLTQFDDMTLMLLREGGDEITY